MSMFKHPERKKLTAKIYQFVISLRLMQRFQQRNTRLLKIEQEEHGHLLKSSFILMVRAACYQPLSSIFILS